MGMWPELVLATSAATRAIGRALAERLLMAGARVWTVGRSDDAPTGVERHRRQTWWRTVCPPRSCRSAGGMAYCPGTIDLKPVRGLRRRMLRQALEVNPGRRVPGRAGYRPFGCGRSGVGMLSSARWPVLGHAISCGRGIGQGRCGRLSVRWPLNWLHVRVNCIAPSLTGRRWPERLLAHTGEAQEAP